MGDHQPLPPRRPRGPAARAAGAWRATTSSCERPRQEVERLCRFLGLAWDRHGSPRRPPASAPRRARGRGSARRPGVDAVLPGWRPSWSAPGTCSLPRGGAGRSAGGGAAHGGPASGEGLRSVHTTNFPRCCASSAPRCWSPPTRAASWSCSAPTGDTSTPTSAASRARWAWPLAAARAGRRHRAPGLGVPQRARASPPARARRPARRLLPAALRPTSPATSRSTRWPGPATSCGSSTRASPACARSTPSTASCRAGGRRSSRALAAEDRCHLNGLAMVDGRPRYVTALAETDTPQGWRREQGAPAAA